MAETLRETDVVDAFSTIGNVLNISTYKETGRGATVR